MNVQSGAQIVVLLSGPNLDLLGDREPEIYGYQQLADHVAEAVDEGRRLGLSIEHHQSNDEGALIDEVHRARKRASAVIVNAGALSHTSWALHDALSSFEGVVVELHLSNPAAREPYRHTSVLAEATDGMICGFGGLGYRLAVTAVGRLLGLATARTGVDARNVVPPAADSVPRPEGWT
jgi:3-dehydroquinate dehydratase II